MNALNLEVACNFKVQSVHGTTGRQDGRKKKLSMRRPPNNDVQFPLLILTFFHSKADDMHHEMHHDMHHGAYMDEIWMKYG